MHQLSRSSLLQRRAPMRRMSQLTGEALSQPLGRDSSTSTKILSFSISWRDWNKANGQQAPEFFRCHLIWPWIAQRVISNYQTWLLMLLVLSLKFMRITHKWLWSYQMSTVLSSSNTISQVIQSSFKILVVAQFKWSTLLQVFLEAQVLCKTKMEWKPIYSK